MVTPDPGRIVIALGGNALEGAPGDVHAQAAAARRAFIGLSPLLDAPHLLITHGNGPQVGNLLLRVEAPIEGHWLPPLPLDTCVADTIGGLGYLLTRELRSVLGSGRSQRPVAAIITTTVVGSLDGAPRKPIGSTWQPQDRAMLESRGWEVREDVTGALRRVVPSPSPVDILEIDVIRQLFDAGVAVVAGGGGGVPVRWADEGFWVGVEAVVDKDLVAAILAAEVEAELLMILTDVEQAYVGFRSSEERPLGDIGVRHLRALHAGGAFGEGSMAPKVEAACRFVESGGGRAVICHLDRALQGIAGTSGTQVTAA